MAEPFGDTALMHERSFRGLAFWLCTNLAAMFCPHRHGVVFDLPHNTKVMDQPRFSGLQASARRATHRRCLPRAPKIRLWPPC